MVDPRYDRGDANLKTFVNHYCQVLQKIAEISGIVLYGGEYRSALDRSLTFVKPLSEMSSMFRSLYFDKGSAVLNQFVENPWLRMSR